MLKTWVECDPEHPEEGPQIKSRVFTNEEVTPPKTEWLVYEPINPLARELSQESLEKVLQGILNYKDKTGKAVTIKPTTAFMIPLPNETEEAFNDRRSQIREALRQLQDAKTLASSIKDSSD